VDAANVRAHRANRHVERQMNGHSGAHQRQAESHRPGELPLHRRRATGGHLEEGAQADEGVVMKVGVDRSERIDA